MDRGEVVRAPFQYADLTQVKTRPAVVISPAGYNRDRDVIVAMVTSRPSFLQQPGVGDVVLRDWQDAGLPVPWVVRTGRLLVLEQRLVGTPLGRLSDTDKAAVEAALREVLAL